MQCHLIQRLVIQQSQQIVYKVEDITYALNAFLTPNYFNLETHNRTLSSLYKIVSPNSKTDRSIKGSNSNLFSYSKARLLIFML